MQIFRLTHVKNITIMSTDMLEAHFKLVRNEVSKTAKQWKWKDSWTFLSDICMLFTLATVLRKTKSLH